MKTIAIFIALIVVVCAFEDKGMEYPALVMMTMMMDAIVGYAVHNDCQYCIF